MAVYNKYFANLKAEMIAKGYSYKDGAFIFTAKETIEGDQAESLL